MTADYKDWLLPYLIPKVKRINQELKCPKCLMGTVIPKENEGICNYCHKEFTYVYPRVIVLKENYT